MTSRLPRICLLLLVFFIPNKPRPSLAEEGDLSGAKLVIGVRSDARPFSYKLPPTTIDSDATRGPLSRAHYSGYMIRICDAVLAEMLIDPEISRYLKMQHVAIYDIDDKYLKLQEDYKKRKEGQQRAAEEEAKKDRANQNNLEQDGGVVPGSAKTGATGEDEKDGPPSPSVSRFDDLGVKFDILCDPATIINDRRGVTVSPPLFLTGISYLTLRNMAASRDGCGDPDPPEKPDATKGKPGQPDQAAAQTQQEEGATNTSSSTPLTEAEKAKQKKPPRTALIGLVGGTTAESRGLQALIDAREMTQYEERLVRQLRQEPGKPACEQGELIKRYPNHEKAAQMFCRGGAFHYYVGDLEIIRTYAGAIPGCKFENGIVTYTNDRYGIFGRAIGEPSATGEQSMPVQSEVEPLLQAVPTAAERQLLVARFFQILAQKVVFNPSVLDKAYSDTFPNQEQSRKLKLFYWAIRGDRIPDTELPAPARKDAVSQPK